MFFRPTLLRLACVRQASSVNCWRSSYVRPFSTNDGGGFFSRVANNVNEKMESRKTEKMDKKFTEQVASLLSKNKFTLGDWKEEIEQTLDEQKWRMKLPGVSNTEEVKQVKQQLAILNGFTPAELKDMRAVKGKTKKRVAAEAGVDERTVNHLLTQFATMEVLHEWLHLRKSKGLPMPESLEEARTLMMKDRTGLKAHKKLRKRKR